MENSRNGYYPDDEAQEKYERDERKKRRRKIRRLIELIIIIIIILLLLRCCGNFNAGDDVDVNPPMVSTEVDNNGDNNSNTDSGDKRFDVAIDSNVTEGGLEGRSKEEIQAELNKKVDASMINISMNTSPVFANGKAEGSLQIVNESINNYPQVIEIYLQNEVVSGDGSVSYVDGEKVYQSGMIPVGSKIMTAKLDTPLEKGEYRAVAYFNAVTETGDYIGRAGANIKLIIEN